MKNVSLILIWIFLSNFFSSAQTWKSIGPEGKSSPSDYVEYNAGQVHSISYDLLDATNNTIYASCPYGGLWKTTDGGSNWSIISKDDQMTNANGGVSDAAIDPTNSQKIFIATGHDEKAKWGASAGVYLTTNGGTTWSATGLVFDLCDKVLIKRLIIVSIP